MKLVELANLLLTAQLKGDGELQIEGIQNDSRRVKQGDLFICLTGHTVDGHQFAPIAAAQGAVAFVAERELEIDAPQIIVKDSRLAMAVLSNYFYGNASDKLQLIGVTGTNGKTTTTYLIEQILNDSGRPTGVIGTIERRFAGRTHSMSSTTPEALELQQYLAEMVENGTKYCAMEVSSHALEQGRVKGNRYRTAVFTNLTQDHLDYHETMERYATAKGLLFARLGNGYARSERERSYAVLNADDAASQLFTRMTSAEIITYGVDEKADVKASNIRITAQGTSFHVETFRGEVDIQLQMVGKFNVYNALAAMTVGLIEGLTLEQIKKSLETVAGVPGRVESINAGQDFAVVVDYAHTPDGLENVLKAVKEFAQQRVLCVFGCGGDRDRTKRPIMGRIAAQYADYVFITSDNPRTENPDGILLDIEAGLIADGVDKSHYEMLVDRRTAIQKAVEMASPGDVVLIAGKGHETYQIIGDVTHSFDDRLVAKEAIRGIVH